MTAPSCPGGDECRHDDAMPQPTPEEEREAVLAERLDWEADRLAAIPASDNEGLDVAWKAAEDAATTLGYSWISLDGRFREECQAGAFGAPLNGLDAVTVTGPTPAAALRALAAAAFLTARAWWPLRVSTEPFWRDELAVEPV